MASNKDKNAIIVKERPLRFLANGDVELATSIFDYSIDHIQLIKDINKGIKKRGLRRLTLGEINLSSSVYGFSIHYQKVWVHLDGYLPFNLQNLQQASIVSDFWLLKIMVSLGMAIFMIIEIIILPNW